MFTNHHFLYVSVLLAGLLAGCGPADSTPDAGPGGGDDESAPLIQTDALAEAFHGRPYVQQVLATGGAKPLVWSLVDVEEGLGWLRADPTTGALGGTPGALVLPGQGFTLLVRDRLERGDRRRFTLAVKACLEGEVADCAVPSGTACLKGTMRCEAGRFGACGGGASNDVKVCGESCGDCGPGANRCTDGRCQCGGAEPCTEPTRPTCCGTSADAACVDTRTEGRHCGTCGNDCSRYYVRGTDSTCVDGTCTFPCAPGHLRCAPDSLECVNAMTDANNCGGCGNVCPRHGNAPPNTTIPLVQECQDGVCQIFCQRGYSDCDQDIRGTGCEVNSAWDLNNCGPGGEDAPRAACGNRCTAPANATPRCSVGKCLFDCNLNYFQCNGQCLSNTNDDPKNCGACGLVCGGKENATSYSCQSGQCKVATCKAGHGDCDGRYDNGCETNLLTDVNNCGQCGMSGCARCESGICHISTKGF
jgi:hypothetical protein